MGVNSSIGGTKWSNFCHDVTARIFFILYICAVFFEETFVLSQKTFMMKMDLDSGRDGKMGSEVDNFDTVTKDMEQDTTTQLVGMGLRTSMSPAQNAFYIILVALGIVGNAIVIGVIGKSVMMDRGPAHSSDIIIVNLAVSNLMVSLLRNMLLIISDLNFKV